MGGPLDGVRVIALEQAVAMPFCSWMLGEMGADVVKLERPGIGDVLRGWDGVAKGLSSGYVWLSGGKRDVAVDLSQEDGREVVRRLAASADVFLENFAPGVVGRLGLDARRLQAANPALIYCSLSGYGQTGPYRSVKAYDLLIQGEAGVLLSNGTPGEPAKVGLPLTDLIGGVTAALGVVAALYRRRTTGLGEFLDVAMFDSVLPWLGYFPQHFWHTGAEPPRSGMRHQYLCPYGPYLAADARYVNLVVASADHWTRFCTEVVLRPDWLADPRFADIETRRTNRGALDELVEGAIAAEPSQVWFRRLAAAGLPYGEVRGIGEVLAHPQIAERGMVTEADSPVGRLPLVRFPLSAVDRDRRVPALGEHTEEVLLEAGYAPDTIAALRASGAVA